MKEAVVAKGPLVHIRDSPIPRPGPRQLLIKVECCSSNPKDWKMPEFMPDAPPLNQGDDISGIVHEVGEGVYEFKKGDRVAALHEFCKPGGGYAEYAIAWDHTTFLLPANTGFEAGSAIPMPALTAVVGLYASSNLALPPPYTPATRAIPLVVYGASSAVGSYVVQFARRSNIHPLICIAGRAQDHVEGLIDRSKGDVVLDYRKGEAAVVQGIRDALKGQPLHYAYDAISEQSTTRTISAALESKGRITLVMPGDYPEIPSSVEQTMTIVGDCHSSKKDLGFVYCRYISRGLEDGWLKPQPQEIVPGGLAGIQGALERLKDGTVSAVKYVFRIAETPGVSA